MSRWFGESGVNLPSVPPNSCRAVAGLAEGSAATSAHARPHRELDALLVQIQGYARLLPAVTPTNGAAERKRLCKLLSLGNPAEPRFELPETPSPRQAWPLLERARGLTAGSPFARMYMEKLDELEIELLMLDALGDPKRMRPLSARRFGTGRDRVPAEGGERPLADIADELLASVTGEREPRTVPPEGAAVSVVGLMREAAEAIGLELTIRVEPRLAAGAATGQKTILVADRLFGQREAIRLTVHEVFGHAVAAANGRAQPLRLLELGTAGSFADQEGLALYLEEQVGALVGYRLRTIAARVWTVDRMHAGAGFPDTTRMLMEEHGFDAMDAVTLCERTYRGGGLARDACYLAGYQRVRTLLAQRPEALHVLRSGRLSTADVDATPALKNGGCYRDPWLSPRLPAAWCA